VARGAGHSTLASIKDSVSPRCSSPAPPVVPRSGANARCWSRRSPSRSARPTSHARRSFTGTFDVTAALDRQRGRSDRQRRTRQLHRVTVIPGRPPDLVQPNIFMALGGFGAEGYDEFNARAVRAVFHALETISPPAGPRWRPC
jgi:hypothetical protein